MLIAGDPGLGKTRLVHECRKLFMAWVGAASGRLPLWLEGKAASYASHASLRPLQATAHGVGGSRLRGG